MDNEHSDWECPRCTLRNNKNKRKCSACYWIRKTSSLGLAYSEPIGFSFKANDSNILTHVDTRHSNKSAVEEERCTKSSDLYPSLGTEKTDEEWHCPQCTLTNDNARSRCEACNCKRPEQPTVSAARGCMGHIGSSTVSSTGSLQYGSDFDVFLPPKPETFGGFGVSKTDTRSHVTHEITGIGKDETSDRSSGASGHSIGSPRAQSRLRVSEQRKKRLVTKKELNLDMNNLFDIPEEAMTVAPPGTLFEVSEGWICKSCKTCNTGGKCENCRKLRPRKYRQRHVSKLVRKMELSIPPIRKQRDEIYRSLTSWEAGSGQLRSAQAPVPKRTPTEKYTGNSGEWNCARCTYLNKEDSVKCKICHGIK